MDPATPESGEAGTPPVALAPPVEPWTPPPDDAEIPPDEAPPKLGAAPPFPPFAGIGVPPSSPSCADGRHPPTNINAETDATYSNRM